MSQESYEHIIKYVTTTPENTNKNVLVTLFNNIKNDKEETDTSDKVVRLVDWEGTILKEYTKNEIEELTELPTPDTFIAYDDVDHELLLFQEWNWNLEDIKAWLTNYTQGELNVGVIYTTTDGEDHNYWASPRGEGASLINRQKRATASIGDSAFQGCFSLTSINIPDGVTSIGINAFNQCMSLTSINIPDGVTSIGVSAFDGCKSLTSINIPNSVTFIGDFAFGGCNSLTSISIPDSITSIRDCAFGSCYSLKSINIPDNVTYIGREAFSYCYSLKSINIPDEVTSIEDYAFNGCFSLVSTNIPDNVTYIGREAFSYCYSLKSINIPDGVTSIWSEAFYNCDNLFDILLEGKPTLSNINAFSDTPSTQKIYVPSANISWFKNTTNWVYFSDRFVAIEDNIEYLESLGYNVDKYKN